MELMNLFTYAKLRGCSRQAVQKAVDDGRLKKSISMGATGKPMINDVELAHLEWEKNTAAKHRPPTAPEFTPPATRNAKPKKPPVAKIPPSPGGEWQEESPIDPGTGLPRVHISRQRREHFEAMAAQAKAEAAAGTHVPREEVSRAAFAVARQVRDTLLLIEERMPDQLASITDPARIRQMLHREFRDALSKLAQEVAADDQHAAT